MNDNETFNYTYSAKEQEEINAIRKKYAELDKQEDKMEQLRRLDASVTKKATAVALIIGVIGALVMGLGMSLVMTELSAAFGLSEKTAMISGIVIGGIGMIPVVLSYPVYNIIVKAERKKLAPEILKLAEELTR
jgi:Mg/Co/Ni transporter MgtE